MLKSFVVINHFFWIRFIVSIVTALFFIFLDADSIVDVIKGKYFLADFLAGFTLTFLLLTYLSWLMTYLDGEYPWHERFTSRLFYQLTAGVIIP
ncbi:MAG TPA: hypothetical protein PLD84_02270, partial [Chitinophagales bacterium]|nr:hypothetical protein [Chitinophagales bacterium]